MSARLPGPRRRRQLLDVALRAFAERGFHRTSMEEVAEAAGVTKPVLYQHFRSKRDLYLELLDDVGNRLMDAVAKAVATADGPRHQVEAGFAAYFNFVADEEDAFRLLFGGGGRRDDQFDKAVRRVEDSIADAVATFIEADVDPEHRRLLAYGLVALAEGTSRIWLADGMAPDPAVLARRTAEMAWAGLRGVSRDGAT
ncbi:MAG TPA: TetR/AcrR family transcriptional regulator [Acidimicrobiales bacterium]|nr:TetR/AcrR family transcriptional regulator [Acidimicrobiales bacterium]